MSLMVRQMQCLLATCPTLLRQPEPTINRRVFLGRLLTVLRGDDMCILSSGRQWFRPDGPTLIIRLIEILVCRRVSEQTMFPDEFF